MEEPSPLLGKGEKFQNMKAAWPDETKFHNWDGGQGKREEGMVKLFRGHPKFAQLFSEPGKS